MLLIDRFSSYKQTSYTSFMKKLNKALKLLDNQITITHSTANTDQCEDYPKHLKEMIVLYKHIKEE